MGAANLEATARELGLSVHGDVEWDLERCFARLRRAIARNEPNDQQRCFAGSWKGRLVVIRWAEGLRGETETHVIAEIDPPLLLCFMIRPGDYATRHVGEFWFDTRYVIHTYDDRVFARLGESVKERSLARFGNDADATTFRVTDTFACIAAPARVDFAAPLAAMLDRACDLAASIGPELADLHDGDWYRRVRDVWRSVAEARGLVLDTEGFAIRGMLAAAEVKLALEAEHDNVATALELSLPEGVSFGFEMIDGLYVAGPPGAGSAAAMTDARSREALSELSADSTRFRVRGRTLYARWLKPLDDAKRIDMALAHASTLAQLFAPGLVAGPAAGPYR